MTGLRRSRCAPGSAASPSARACCCAGDRRGLGRVQPVPGVRRRPSPSRGCAAPRRRPPATGRRRCARGCRSTSRCRPSAPSGRTRSCAAGGLPHRQGQGRRARADRSADDEARLEAVRDALGPDGRVRVDANGGWDVDEAVARDPRCSTAPPAGWSTSSSRARASRTWPRSAGGSTSRSRPTSRSAGPPTPTGCATSRRPTSRCSRCSRWAASGPACGSPRTSGCRSWCRGAGDLGRHRGRGRARGRAARAALRLRPGDRAAAHRRRRVADPLLPVDGALPVRAPPVDEAALDAAGRGTRAGRALGGPARRGGAQRRGRAAGWRP